MTTLSASRLSTLARVDARAVVRDPFLLIMLAGPVVLVVIVRLATQPVTAALGRAGIDAGVYEPLAAGFLVAMLIPHLLGGLTGLLLLDERDAGLLLAMRVSPLGLDSYLAWRLGLAGVAAGVGVGLGLPLSGLVDASVPVIATVALLAALLAPVPALLLPAFGTNKVEGLAMLKAAGLPLLSPVAAWFVAEPWRWTFGIIPTAWPTFVLWEADAGGTWPLVAAVGAGVLMLAVTWLWRRVARCVVTA